MNTIDEMIEVLQAMKEGKAIECRELEDGDGEWYDVEHWHPDFSTVEYRVKKEPMVFWAVVCNEGISDWFFNQQTAEEWINRIPHPYNKGRVVKFVEEI